MDGRVKPNTPAIKEQRLKQIIEKAQLVGTEIDDLSEVKNQKRVRNRASRKRKVSKSLSDDLRSTEANGVNSDEDGNVKVWGALSVHPITGDVLTPGINVSTNKKRSKRKAGNEDEELKLVAPQLQDVARVLPKWLSDPMLIDTSIKTESEALDDALGDREHVEDFRKFLVAQCHAHKIVSLFPLQLAVARKIIGDIRNNMPSALRTTLLRRDLCVSAATGSGKTLAFVVPLVYTMRRRALGWYRPRIPRSCRALIVAPTRLLCAQIHSVLVTAIRAVKDVKLSAVAMCGEKRLDIEENQVKNGVDFVVCTPGRLVEHLETGALHVAESLEVLVIDEADRVLADQRQGWLARLHSALQRPQGGATAGSVRRLTSSDICAPTLKLMQTIDSDGRILKPLAKYLFSATLSHDPTKLDPVDLHCPLLMVLPDGTKQRGDSGSVDLGEHSKYLKPKGLEEVAYRYMANNTKASRFYHLLVNILPKRLKAYLTDEKLLTCLIFVKSKSAVNNLTQLLNEMHKCDSNNAVNLRVSALDANPNDRRKYLRRDVFQTLFVKSETITDAGIEMRAIVSTDIAARGLDLAGGRLSVVVSYDLPESVKTYVHRTGRTARANQPGIAVLLADPSRYSTFTTLLAKKTGRQLSCLESGSGTDERKALAHIQALYEKALPKFSI